MQVEKNSNATNVITSSAWINYDHFRVSNVPSIIM